MPMTTKRPRCVFILVETKTPVPNTNNQKPDSLGDALSARVRVVCLMDVCSTAFLVTAIQCHLHCGILPWLEKEATGDAGEVRDRGHTGPGPGPSHSAVSVLCNYPFHT